MLQLPCMEMTGDTDARPAAIDVQSMNCALDRRHVQGNHCAEAQQLQKYPLVNLRKCCRGNVSRIA